MMVSEDVRPRAGIRGTSGRLEIMLTALSRQHYAAVALICEFRVVDVRIRPAQCKSPATLQMRAVDPRLDSTESFGTEPNQVAPGWPPAPARGQRNGDDSTSSRWGI